MTPPAIQVERLSKRYGPVRAVHDVSFEVAPGELVGFLGPNGAGKSTTMRILTTFLSASSGIARVCGFDVMSDSMRVRENIGYLPESVPLYTEMRVEEYLTYRAKLKGVPRAARTARIEECLDRCRVREVRRRLLGTLSKGYRQRVGLADALIADPPVLILDEPTSGLDPVQIGETLKTIKGLGGKHTVLLSTHILSEVEATCDRVMIIARGTLRWDGRLSELSERVNQSSDRVYLVEVRGEPADAEAALARVPGVARVTGKKSGGLTAFEVRAAADAPAQLGEDLARRVVEGGFGLARLEARRKSLDSLYLDVVVRAESAPVA